MGTQYKELSEKDIAFIEKQHVFFVASSSGKEVNLSSKGYNSLKVLSQSQLLFLDFPGSGNRTARDIENNGEVTVMFNSSEPDEAKILRTFCKGKITKSGIFLFINNEKIFQVEEKYIRQFFILDIYAVETSCGDAVPIMKFEKRRDGLFDWVQKMEKTNKLEKYIEDHSIPPKLDDL